MKGPRKKPPGPLVSHVHGTYSPKTLSSAECQPWATCRVSATEDADGNKTPSSASKGSHSRGSVIHPKDVSRKHCAREPNIESGSPGKQPVRAAKASRAVAFEREVTFSQVEFGVG